jgi:enoyl-CoA hydratase
MSSTEVSTEVRTERVGSSLLITIDRPKARNAVNAAVAAGVTAALDELEADTGLRVGVLTGAGGTFCTGMDLKAALKGETPEVPGRGFAGLTEAQLSKPLIAAVEGYALGGGFELALGCDLIAAGGGVIRLPKRIPYHLAMEFLLTGQPVSGRQGAELGVVNRVTAPGEAVAVALKLAEQLTLNAPLALTAVKKMVRAADGVPEADAFALQRKVFADLMASADVREGMTAFAERRAPQWKGK